MSEVTFSLNADQVPEPPDSNLWTDVLRWAVMVMDPADPRLAFICSVLSQAIEKDGLSEKQSKACLRIIGVIRKDFSAGILVCQNTIPADLSDQMSSERTLN